MKWPNVLLVVSFTAAVAYALGIVTRTWFQPTNGNLTDASSIVFVDDFSGEELDSIWKIENRMGESGSVSLSDGVLVLSNAVPPNTFQDLRIDLDAEIPRTDFEVSVDFRIPEGAAMPWLFVDDPGYSQHFYGAYFLGPTRGYRVWEHNDSDEGRLGTIREAFGDEQTQWHNLKLQYDSELGVARTSVDGESTSSLSEFYPDRCVVGMQLKNSSMYGTEPARIEFDNFRLTYESNDLSSKVHSRESIRLGNRRAAPRDSSAAGSIVDTRTALENARNLISSGDRRWSVWNAWSRRAYLHYRERQWAGSDQEAQLGLEVASGRPEMLTRVAYFYLLAAKYGEYDQFCQNLINNADKYTGQDLAQASIFCSLNPLPPKDPDGLLRLAERAVEFGPEFSLSPRWFIDARVGNFERAWEGHQAFRGTDANAMWPEFDLAVAYKLAGRDDEARKCLDDANSAFESWKSRWPNHYLEMEVLREEAERRIMRDQEPSVEGWRTPQ